MKRVKASRKLLLSRQTIHILSNVSLLRAKGGAVSQNVICPYSIDTTDGDTWFPTITNTATNDQSCPGGYSCALECGESGPGASAITRCATGGLCIPSYSCKECV
jgi:hypothetical protein